MEPGKRAVALGSGKRTLVALLLITGLVESATAAIYTVGDSTGWTIPSTPAFYDDWASSITFVVGDQLVFNYPAQVHSVLEVTQADLSSCNLNSPLVSHQNSGGVTITLNTTGFHGFICGVPTHCTLNMKLSLTVTGTATPPAAAPSSPPTVAPASPPTPAPVSTPTLAPVSPPTPTQAPTTPPTKAPVSTPAKTPSPVPSSKSPSPAPAKKLSPTPSPSPSVVEPAFAPGPSSTTTGSASALRSGLTVIVKAVVAAVAAGVLMF